MLKRFSLPVAAAVAMTGFLVPQAVAEEPAAASQCEMVQVIESGTLKWGVKHSYRQYILNNKLANGNWKVAGDIKEVGEKRGKDFYFEVPVDPQISNLEIKDNKIVEAEINTKDSSIVFEGHHGSLYSELHNPYVTTKDNVVKAGVSYVGYYVPGKNMTEYKEADRTEANKRSGRDTFGNGTTAGWTLNETDATLSGSNMRYVPQPKTKDNVIDGVDVLFMGQYDGKTNSNLDDVKVDLKLKKVCKDEAEKLKAEYKKNVELASQKAAHSQSGSGTGGESTSTAPTSSTSGFNLSTLWSTILGISGVAALLGILFQVAQKAGWIRF
ncbi:HtaA domain-containing protein [Corynebacterium diphtheriae bv. mitis]|uniref:HtaA domain-containing protein n=1 Tax=Corynebacterium diphtheriae TaxID=1717 RepID=UPI0013C7FAF2|nr:HtaA domain-containing protein [Corynebacterium diphtheriae]MBG9246247.1 HtaA domain-containing protein [Corynebacterium diphtheriae bv. mitis]UJM22362.1 HtaA domain-containing protein [Corynebacterium diphtheriae]CAB0836541.1 hemin receptor [Corynebacterium diphtheriae]CAB0896628.1 hemin receptor [Corynebacterium diphtheriae]